MTAQQVRDSLTEGTSSCLTNSAPDEPVFVLVARDQLAVQTLDYWIKLAEHAGVNDAKLNGARRDLAAMAAWGRTHGVKVPD